MPDSTVETQSSQSPEFVNITEQDKEWVNSLTKDGQIETYEVPIINGMLEHRRKLVASLANLENARNTKSKTPDTIKDSEEIKKLLKTTRPEVKKQLEVLIEETGGKMNLTDISSRGEEIDETLGELISWGGELAHVQIMEHMEEIREDANFAIVIAGDAYHRASELWKLTQDRVDIFPEQTLAKLQVAQDQTETI